MNRIILIGNGFDLAHGMKTSYQDFLDDYWKSTIASIKESQLSKRFENDEFTIDRSPSEFVRGDTYKDLKKALKEQDSRINYKNKFLEILTDKSYLENWVDVENEYYFLLKNSYAQKTKSIKNDYNVKALNADFEIIKKKLRTYLKRVEKKFEENIKDDFYTKKEIIAQKIYQPFKLKDFSESSKNQKAELEYNLIKKDIEGLEQEQITMDDLKEDKRHLIEKVDRKNTLASIKKLLESESANNYFDLTPKQTLFLNFNYTFTEKKYVNPGIFSQLDYEKLTETMSIHIHGTTDVGDNNNIIFGFGDEIDEDYKSIEKLNDNDYLENIKSINYLETDNYKRLLEYVNSENFQIFIFGHSCGISDRTMLNTIFEHDNCASIKLFYHQKSVDKDNYSDIIRNISRNFNDKAKMRDRVVNKNDCEPLMEFTVLM